MGTAVKTEKRQANPRIPDNVWDLYDKKLFQLYIVEKQTVKQVQATMEKEHNFNATERQYTYHFKDKKNWRRYKCVDDNKTYGEGSLINCKDQALSESSFTMNSDGMKKRMLQDPGATLEYYACFSDAPQDDVRDTVQKLGNDVRQLNQAMASISLRGDDDDDKGAIHCLLFFLEWISTELAADKGTQDNGGDFLLPSPFVDLLVWVDDEAGGYDDGDGGGVRIYTENMCLLTYLFPRWIATVSSRRSPSSSTAVTSRQWTELCRYLYATPVRVTLAMASMITSLYRTIGSPQRSTQSSSSSSSHPVGNHNQQDQQQESRSKRQRVQKQQSCTTTATAISCFTAEQQQQQRRERATERFRRLLEGVEITVSRMLKSEEWCRPETLLDQFRKQYVHSYRDGEDVGNRDQRLKNAQRRAEKAVREYLKSLEFPLPVPVPDEDTQGGGGGGDDGDLSAILGDSVVEADWMSEFLEEVEERGHLHH